MTERTLEVERKFSAPQGFSPDFEGVAEVVGEATHQLEATYVDTLALALTQAGWSLRRRVGGHDDGWHLKRPATGSARVEVQAPDAPELPAALDAEAREVARQEALLPVARLSTARVETTLARDGVPVAVLARDAVRATTAVGEDAWSEVELELLPGVDPALLPVLAAALERGGATPAPHASKAARALASVPRFVPPTSPDAPARDVLLAGISRQVGVLQAWDAGVRADAPDAVHKSRVATRRLRSLLKTFGRLFDRRVTDPLRAELRWLGAELGGPRDAEVLAAEFGDLLAELGPDAVPPDRRRALLGHLEQRHARAHAELVRALDSDRARRLRADLVGLLIEPPLRGRALNPATTVMPQLRRRAIERVLALREDARQHPDDLAGWHEVRKAAKAVRYASEAMVGAFGADLEAEAEAWEAVTEAYGTLQDTAVASALIDEVAAAIDTAADPLWAALRHAQADRGAAAFDEGARALDEALARG